MNIHKISCPINYCEIHFVYGNSSAYTE